MDALRPYEVSLTRRYSKEEIMITLTPAEKNLRAYLIDLARRDEDWLRPYGRVAADTDPEHDPNDRRHARLKKRLFHVSSYEVEHDRPMLSALVVRSVDYQPGNGMYELARGLGRMMPGDAERQWWNAELDEVRRYWRTKSDDPIKDAQFDAIMAELAVIKRMLRSMIHG